MKFKQMEYVLAVARTGSFTQAAKEMYVSQPNISSAIISLENTIGFPLFRRTNYGVELTSEGSHFVELANKIIADIEGIPGIIKNKSRHEFKIGTTFTHTALSQAFIKLCIEYQDSSDLNLSCYSDCASNIIDGVYMNNYELGVIFVDMITYNRYVKSSGGKNLIFKHIKTLNMNVNLRNDHPLLQEETFDFNKLYDYPFVNYNHNAKPISNIASEFPIIASRGIVNLNKIINVDEKEMRRDVVISTNAFSIGASYHPKMQSIDQVTSLPIPDAEMVLALVGKENPAHSEELKKFIGFLNEELAVLIKMV